MCTCLPLVPSEPVGQFEETCLLAAVEKGDFISKPPERSCEDWLKQESISYGTHTWGSKAFFRLVLVGLLAPALTLLGEEVYSRCQKRRLKRTLKCLL